MALALALPGFVFVTSTASAHSDHAQRPETVIRQMATSEVKQLVGKGKLDASWKDVEAGKAEQRITKGIKEWVITFNNPKEKDATKQNLYVFLTSTGDFVAANHTGK